MADNRLVVAYTDDDGDAKSLKIEDLTGNAARDLGIEGESETGKIDGTGILLVNTLGDVVNAINYATENNGHVTATIDGNYRRHPNSCCRSCDSGCRHANCLW